MTTHQQPRSGALLAGGGDGTASIVRQGSAAVAGDAAADPWPSWARPQLLQAVALADAVAERGNVASVLYREWFNPALLGADLRRGRRPLAGLYRAAHAGSARRVRDDGMLVVDRHDVVGTDGWWRTWGEYWTPPRSRPGSIRVLFTPQPDRLGEFVNQLTHALLDSREPWALACATNPRRVRRVAPAVLDVRNLDALPAGLLARLDAAAARGHAAVVPAGGARGRHRDLSGQRDGLRRTPLPPDRHCAAPPEQHGRPAPRDRGRLHRARHRSVRPAPLSGRFGREWSLMSRPLVAKPTTRRQSSLRRSRTRGRFGALMRAESAR